MVIDSRLPYVINPFQGLKFGGTVILNSRLCPEEATVKLGLKNIGGIAVVKATDIAKEVLRTPITNMVMLGAFSKMHGAISLDSMKQGIRTVFGEGERGDQQIQAAEIGYKNTEVMRHDKTENP
jgi:Pyruvate/2-oxoacid:ferredoxin oxidoreductase gamma subunit